LYGDLTDQSRDFFSSVLDLAQEEEDKVKQENDTHIYQEICSSLESEELAEEIERIRKHGEHEESRSYTKEYEKMERIKTLLLGNIQCHKEYDKSRDDEEYLEEIHGKIISYQVSNASSFMCILSICQRSFREIFKCFLV
jgi:hypothetical protein